MSEDPYDDASAQFDETPDAASIVTDSILDEQEVFPNSQMSASRKRKRDQISLEDQYHQIWSDQLLDYFMLLHSEDRLLAPPEPHPGVNVDRPIDDKGHSAMHWASAMGDLDTVRDLINRGAHIDSLSESQETPLMRAVLFTNNLDKQTMPEMVSILAPTILRKDWFGSTVVHHIAATTSSKNKYKSARYYLECITTKLLESWGPEQTARFLNEQDRNGDTAIMIAARHGARKCVRHLLQCNASTNIVNSNGENAAEMIQSLNKRLRERHMADRSSSPMLPDGLTDGGAQLQPNSLALATGNGVGSGLLQPPAPHYTSQTAATLMNKVAPQIVDKFVSLAQAYETEFHDREAELNESLGVHRKRQAELEAQRTQLVEVMDSATSNGDHDVAAAAAAVLRASRGEATPEEAERMWTDATATIQRRDEDENSTLMTHEGEAEREVNLLSRLELERNIAESEDKRGIKGDDERYEPLGNIDPAHQDEILQLTQQLDVMEADRMMLVKEIVQDMSYAGVSEKQAEYKKLISLSIPGISEDQVDEVLPEIIADLEEEKRGQMLDEAD
jgi:transcription factor MBP1